MDNVGCHGYESTIEICQHLGWGNHNCGHSEDASVICSRKFTISLKAQHCPFCFTRLCCCFNLVCFGLHRSLFVVQRRVKQK